MVTVVFPKLGAFLGEKFFVSQEFCFFFDLLINVVNERANSKTVVFCFQFNST